MSTTKEFQQPTYIKVPLSLIDVTQFENARNDLKGPDWDEFVANIKSTNGPIQAPAVRRDGDGYSLIFGFRRYAACEEAEIPEITVALYEVDEEGARVLNIIENMQRKDLHWSEVAWGFKQLRDAEYSVNRIANRCNVSQATVRLHLYIADAPWFTTACERVRNGESNLSRERASEVEKNTRDMTKAEAIETYLATVRLDNGEEPETDESDETDESGEKEETKAVKKSDRFFVTPKEAKAMLARARTDLKNQSAGSTDAAYSQGVVTALTWLLTKSGAEPLAAPDSEPKQASKGGRKSAKQKAKEAAASGLN